MKLVMNDYELIYLIQSNHCHIALEFLYHKYCKLIWKNVHLLGVEDKEHEDFYQEGCLMLIKAVNTFNEAKNKSFTRYFEMILKRQLYQLVRRLPAYELSEDACLYQGSHIDIYDEPIRLKFESKLEVLVHQKHFIESQKIKDIATDLDLNIKTIYNAIYRIKEKYKNML